MMIVIIININNGINNDNNNNDNDNDDNNGDNNDHSRGVTNCHAPKIIMMIVIIININNGINDDNGDNDDNNDDDNDDNNNNDYDYKHINISIISKVKNSLGASASLVARELFLLCDPKARRTVV